MKRAAIVYFSGTGNTKFIADNMKSVLNERGISTDLINIEKDTMLCQNYDYLIIGAPIYVDRYPEKLLDYLKITLKKYSKKCMLFSTQSYDKPTCAFQDLINRVPFIDVSYCEFISMPNNFYNFMFKKRTKEEENKLIEEAVKKSKQAVNSYLAGEKQIYHKSFLEVEFVNIVYNLFYPYITKRMTNNITIDLNKCIHCKLCEMNCPTNCIKVSNKASFNDRCLLCQRCMNNCPKGAFLYKNRVYKKYNPNFKFLNK